MQIGPIGSRCALLTLWVTASGPRVQAGCFFDTLDQFEQAVAAEHGDNIHSREYGAAIAMMRAHANLWPAAVAVEKEVA